MSKEDRKKSVDLPTEEQLEKELQKYKRRNHFLHVLLSTLFILATVAASAILVAVLILPVLRIQGSSMNPNLTEGDLVLSVKGSGFETGDVVAFYYNNEILVKRVIAYAGEWVDIDEDGNVYVNDKKIDEPYLLDKALGSCNIKLPYQVPESKIFVMGDNRSVSIDSRNTAVGCVSQDQIVGKIIWVIWPFHSFGSVG